jgi:hypothetical protein
MHDYLFGFVCLLAGVVFVVIVGPSLFEGRSQEPPSPADKAIDGPAVEPRQWPWNDPDRHAAWPECGCPSEAFHTKYYPGAGADR